MQLFCFFECDIGERGKHEWLDVYIAFGADPDHMHVYDEFLKSDFFTFNAANRKFKSTSDEYRFKYECITYLFETCYDLMLSSKSNVSESPGFEKYVMN